MHNKLKSLTAIFCLAAALTGCTARRAFANEIPEKKPSPLQEMFNLHAEAQAKPVPLEQVIDIFNQLSDMNLAFSLSEEGCFARTHLMNLKMIEMGITPQKAWADTPLLPQLPEEKFIDYAGSKIKKIAPWEWHVAPSVPTLMPDGKVEDLIIDPALFNCPVSKKTWAETIGAPFEKIEITALGTPPKNRKGDYIPNEVHTPESATKDALKVMKIFDIAEKKFQEEPTRKVFSSEICSGRTSQQQGHTWTAVPKPK